MSAALPDDLAGLLNALPTDPSYPVSLAALKSSALGQAVMKQNAADAARWVSRTAGVVSEFELTPEVGGLPGSPIRTTSTTSWTTYGVSYVHRVTRGLSAYASALLRRKFPFTAEELETVVRWSIGVWGRPRAAVVRAVEWFANDHAIPEFLSEALLALDNSLQPSVSMTPSEDSDQRKIGKRITKLLAGEAELPLRAGEAWSDAVIAFAEQCTDAERQAWLTLLEHCGTASAGKPSAKWTKTAREQVAEIGLDTVAKNMQIWLPFIAKPRTETLEQPQWGPDPNLMLDDLNADVLKGLIWCAAGWEDPAVARAIATAALSAYKKVAGVGPRATKVGNACVWTLGQMPGDTALGSLAVLKVRVKFGTAQKGIEKALNAVAERTGTAREELEELAVPGYGLTEVGMRAEQMGDFTAELVVTATTSTELRWRKADGKLQKSVPAAVKSEFPNDLKALKAAAKDIKKMLPAQRDRIDNLFSAQKTWTYDVWRTRYLDHPLVGTLARRLIWWIGVGDLRVAAMWHDGALRDVGGTTIEPASDAAVALWHPIEVETGDIVAWRERLETLPVQQPFKQAHREIYRLTAAERNTDVYSNRYATHILKQHQFNALCQTRGWKNQLRLMVDDEYGPAHLMLPGWGLRAEFWIEGIDDEYGQDTTEAGTYLYVATDQVRFYREDACENSAHSGGGGYRTYGAGGPENVPLRLETIPELVFSEVMRDVDLFVGVASVGNDPNWSDGGPEGRHVTYWYGTSFGDLSESAKTRRDVLRRLIPRLKIADRCTLSDRFLVVRGAIRTYNIHLGSANILMEPNDQYLCIVPAQGKARAAGQVFLPFEGDSRIAVILSKAFLLAEDNKITDPTILTQLY